MAATTSSCRVSIISHAQPCSSSPIDSMWSAKWSMVFADVKKIDVIVASPAARRERNGWCARLRNLWSVRRRVVVYERQKLVVGRDRRHQTEAREREKVGKWIGMQPIIKL